MASRQEIAATLYICGVGVYVNLFSMFVIGEFHLRFHFPFSWDGKRPGWSEPKKGISFPVDCLIYFFLNKGSDSNYIYCLNIKWNVPVPPRYLLDSAHIESYKTKEKADNLNEI